MRGRQARQARQPGQPGQPGQVGKHCCALSITGVFKFTCTCPHCGAWLLAGLYLSIHIRHHGNCWVSLPRQPASLPACQPIFQYLKWPRQWGGSASSGGFGGASLGSAATSGGAAHVWFWSRVLTAALSRHRYRFSSLEGSPGPSRCMAGPGRAGGNQGRSSSSGEKEAGPGAFCRPPCGPHPCSPACPACPPPWA